MSKEAVLRSKEAEYAAETASDLKINVKALPVPFSSSIVAENEASAPSKPCVVIDVENANHLASHHQVSTQIQSENDQNLYSNLNSIGCAVNQDSSNLAVSKPNTCESCGQQLFSKPENPVISTTATAAFPVNVPVLTSETQLTSSLCRICHCEAETGTDPLITPCRCKGSLGFVHHSCLQRWIKSSGHKQCELCGFHFVMRSKLKPISEWETLKMSSTEKRRVLCSVFFHIIAILCVGWSLYVLIDRTTHEVQKENMEWPFWTKLAVVVVGLIGGLAFMYMQCKSYCELWSRLLSFNKLVFIQDRPSEITAPPLKNSRLEIPMGIAKGIDFSSRTKHQTNRIVV